MRREDEGGEIDGILKEHANNLIEETDRSIHKYAIVRIFISYLIQFKE